MTRMFLWIGYLLDYMLSQAEMMALLIMMVLERVQPSWQINMHPHFDNNRKL